MTKNELLDKLQLLQGQYDEINSLYNVYKTEIEEVFDIAQKLDALNPSPSSFMGSPSERIAKHLKHLNIAGFED